VETRFLVADGSGRVRPVDTKPDQPITNGWIWVDVRADADDLVTLLDLADHFGLDRIAVRDAVLDLDMPKADDFGDHLLIVLHTINSQMVQTYEVDCFLMPHHLITIRPDVSDPIDTLWTQAQHRHDIGKMSVDEVAGVLADLMTRSLLAVLDAFDNRVEELNHDALRADPRLLEDLTAVRSDLAGVRRVVHPQRESLDVLRHSSSDLISDNGRRRFSDVFDVASRLTSGLDEARSALAETLDAYRGAEARQATEVSKVLTVYAAVLLPLSLIAGFFGMNFTNLPWIHRSWGWFVVTLIMIVVAVVSIGMFISLGWIRKPSGRRAGRVIGNGLIEATKTPAHLMSAMFEMSAMPIRATTAKISQAAGGNDRPGRSDASAVRTDRSGRGSDEPAESEDAAHHGSE
jgi:magnesium transporter